mgnify:CR=1 FL=1
MAYTDIDTANRAADASGELKSKIRIAYVRKAVARLSVIANNEDQREATLCKRIVGAGATVTDVLDKPALTRWKVEQVALAALENAERLVADRDNGLAEAAVRGSRGAALERWLARLDPAELLLPQGDRPEAFGQHPNAEISYLIEDSKVGGMKI